jgi:hypothetical protein
MKFKVGDVVIDGYGDRFEVTELCKDNESYPYIQERVMDRHIWS